MNFRPGVPEDWPFVAYGLAQILKKCGPMNWTPPDVSAHIAEGRSGIFVCDDGFVILEVLTEPLSERRYLNVWLAWFKPKAGVRKRKELVAWLDEMREKTDSHWWEFRSPRQGWKIIEPDCEIHSIIWRRKNGE